jgi:hypothetical protein
MEIRLKRAATLRPITIPQIPMGKEAKETAPKPIIIMGIMSAKIPIACMNKSVKNGQ